MQVIFGGVGSGNGSLARSNKRNKCGAGARLETVGARRLKGLSYDELYPVERTA
jgi:hypothetical protein